MSEENEKKSNLIPWKPGQSGNPKGRPKLSDEEKKLRKLSKEQFKEIGDMIVNGKVEELFGIMEDPDATVLQKLVARGLQEAYEKGNWAVVNLLLDRLIGKVKEEVDVNLPRPTVVKFKDGLEIVMGATKDEEKE